MAPRHREVDDAVRRREHRRPEADPQHANAERRRVTVSRGGLGAYMRLFGAIGVELKCFFTARQIRLVPPPAPGRWRPPPRARPAAPGAVFRWRPDRAPGSAPSRPARRRTR